MDPRDSQIGNRYFNLFGIKFIVEKVNYSNL